MSSGTPEPAKKPTAQPGTAIKNMYTTAAYTKMISAGHPGRLCALGHRKAGRLRGV